MTLAIHGGEPVRNKAFSGSITTGDEELEAGIRVLKSGVLSGFVGSPGDQFFGGKEVRALEALWSQTFNVQYSLSCNSATSALIMAVGALEIGPGDEVIVPPYTMSATATAILFYNAIPVFVDIEEDMFCLDPAKIEAAITPETRAIITVDIHGQSSDIEAIMSIAKKHGLKVISDSSQAPGARYQGRHAGTLADIGVFSLNRHKNIQCGEGGIAVTNDEELKLRMSLIRNHAEALVGSGDPRFTPKSLVNMMGYNFRMTEIEAAIAQEQLKKLSTLNAHRLKLTQYLHDRLKNQEILTLPKVRENATHIYYMDVYRFNEHKAGISRSQFIKALNAEGIPIWGGYLKPLYLEPLYQEQSAYKTGYPFKNNSAYSKTPDYSKGLCPVAERLYEKETIINIFNYYPLSMEDVKDIADGILKVIDNLDELR